MALVLPTAQSLRTEEAAADGADPAQGSGKLPRAPSSAAESPHPAPQLDGELTSARLRTTRPRRLPQPQALPPTRRRRPYLGTRRRRCLGGGEGGSGATVPNGHEPRAPLPCWGEGREAERRCAPLPHAALSRNARPPPQGFQAARALHCGPAPAADYKSQSAPRGRMAAVREAAPPCIGGRVSAPFKLRGTEFLCCSWILIPWSRVFLRAG